MTIHIGAHSQRQMDPEYISIFESLYDNRGQPGVLVKNLECYSVSIKRAYLRVLLL